VWLIEENLRAELIQLGAHVSVVKYTLYGTVYEVVTDNDNFNNIGEEGNDDED
jgi:hypothetical protein